MTTIKIYINKYIPAKFIAAVFIFSFIQLISANDIDTINRKQEIAQLLKELRELRKAKYTLINEWKDEKVQLELMMDLDSKKIATLNETIVNATDSVEELTSEANKLTEKNIKIDNELVKISQWIDKECQHIIDASSKDYPILITEEHLVNLKNIIMNEKETTLKVGQFLNIIQTLSISAIKPYINFREIEIKGKIYGANIIRLGGVLEYFVTPDGKFGGVKTNSQDKDDWIILNADMNRQLQEMVRVIKKETDTKLVTIPIPSKDKKVLTHND